MAGRAVVCGRAKKTKPPRPAPVIEVELTPGIDPEQARLACGQALAEALAEVRAVEGVRA